MASLGSFLDTGDKVASIAGAAAGLAAIWFARRRLFRRRPDSGVTALLAAQVADARQHRYRFFGEHVPALTDLYVRSRATLESGDTPRTIEAGRILAAHRHAVLLGDAGAGKSTFLATVAAELAGRAQRRRGRGEIAVVLPAADLVGRRLPEALARAAGRDLAVEVPAALFEKPPPGGVWRVLVDGLDEVVAPESRSEVLWRIRGLFADPGPYRLVVTCRPLAAAELAELHGPNVGVYDLRPFDRRELDEFAHRWFAARFPDDRPRADRTAGRFLARVAGARLGPVARVPLLATIAALVYESADDRTLPSSRAALYDRFVDHLLDGRRSLERFREAVEPELLSRGPSGAEVAAWLCSDIRQHVGGVLRACGAAWLADPDVLLTEVAASWIDAHSPHGLGPSSDRLVRELLLVTGVCTLRRNRVVFAHQSFAEYFAAYSFAARFETSVWAVWAAEPATRSLAAFAAARRPDSDALVAGLTDPLAAGDLLADGIPVRPATRSSVIGVLLDEVAGESEAAPEALRILGELSLDADVLDRMAEVARDPEASFWTRALVADRIADIDVATGHATLRAVAEHADEVVRSWIADTLDERGGRFDPNLRVPLAADTVPANRPLGALARQALTKRLADARASGSERVAAARQLAVSGDLGPLTAMASDADLDPTHRVQLAAALADAGEPGMLRDLAGGLAETPQAMYAAALDLFERRDPGAAEALSAVAGKHPTLPMAYGAAARCAELGDTDALIGLARRPGEIHVRLNAALLLARLGDLRGLRRLLDEPMAPGLEATALAGLLEAGDAEAQSRLRRLLDGRGVRSFRHTQLRYLLAARGDERSRDFLRRRARRQLASSMTVEAAVALTVLGDPVGPDRLRHIASRPVRRQRSRMRAASGLTAIDPSAGLRLLTRLAQPGSPSGLRLRSATVALGAAGSERPLAGIALDRAAPAKLRAGGVEALAQVRANLPPALVAGLEALAADDRTPARVRAAAAPFQPDDEAIATLTGIALSRESMSIRVAAIDQLELLDSRAAGELFVRLVTDRSVGRVRRGLLMARYTDLLPDDYALDDPISFRIFARNVVTVAIRGPEGALRDRRDATAT
ncbi:NACHT domain-containing protein [Actinoplanes sp. NPDC051513]|uniref:NACHT domain-containing protein n=1 Tax=Actinoplanes sp. NPDC051513 TaxID=3363908 RepID=UPI00379CBB59